MMRAKRRGRCMGPAKAQGYCKAPVPEAGPDSSVTLPRASVTAVAPWGADNSTMSQLVPQPPGPISADDLHEAPLQRGFPKWDWRSLPFVLMHVGAVVLPFFTTFSWKLVALAIGLYLVRMFALTGFYHRYFSHRSFKTSRAFQFVMAVWGLTCVQKGPLWWAANHRHHHKHSDQHGDVHSPGLQGFIWAHMGWIMGDDWHDTNLEGVPDLVKYPELRWLDKYHLVPGVAMGVLCYLIGGMPVLVWGFVVST